MKQSSIMRAFLLLTLIALFGVQVSAQDKKSSDKEQSGINFYQGSWEEVLEKSKKKEKPIFVDAYASWCGPCKWMSRNVFTDEKVGEFYNKHFINVKLDMEKGEGRTFARQYGVSAYPTLLYLNSEGKVVHKVMGAKRPDGFIQEGKKANSFFD